MSQLVYIYIKNWRGEYSQRLVEPLNTWFGTTEWHKTPQWFLRAQDTIKEALRDFALVDVFSWAIYTAPPTPCTKCGAADATTCDPYCGVSAT